MTNQVTELTAVRKRARADRRGYWLPFLLFGLITLAATPFYGPKLCVDSGQNPELLEPRVCSWSSADLPWLYHRLHPTGQMAGPVFGLHQPSIAPDLY